MEKIIWTVDHDYSYGSYLLSGDYNGNRFVRSVKDGFFGIPLIYAKWIIKRQFKIIE